MFGELKGTIGLGSRFMDGLRQNSVHRVSEEDECSRCMGVDVALYTSFGGHNKEEILKDRALFKDGVFGNDDLIVSYFGCLDLHFFEFLGFGEI